MRGFVGLISGGNVMQAVGSSQADMMSASIINYALRKCLAYKVSIWS